MKCFSINLHSLAKALLITTCFAAATVAPGRGHAATDGGSDSPNILTDVQIVVEAGSDTLDASDGTDNSEGDDNSTPDVRCDTECEGDYPPPPPEGDDDDDDIPPPPPEGDDDDDDIVFEIPEVWQPENIITPPEDGPRGSSRCGGCCGRGRCGRGSCTRDYLLKKLEAGRKASQLIDQEINAAADRDASRRNDEADRIQKMRDALLYGGHGGGASLGSTSTTVNGLNAPNRPQLGDSNSTTISLKVVQPEDVVEGAFSGAVERALEKALDGQSVPFENNWGNKIRVQTGVHPKRVKKCGKGPFGGEHCWWALKDVHTYSKLNHGSWTRGSVKLGDDLDVEISNVRRQNDTVKFSVDVDAQLRGSFEARVYNHGQLMAPALRGEARAEVSLDVDVQVSFKRTGAKSFDWSVRSTSADVELKEIHLDKIGHETTGFLGGKLAHLMGQDAHQAMKDFFNARYRAYLMKAENAVRDAINRDGSVHAPKIKWCNRRVLGAR